jgi:Spy/CpxP family protein refolding chaperone
MKKVLAVAAMLTVMAGAASAQGGGGGGMGRGRGTPEQQDSTQLARLFDGITLNADQTMKAKEIIRAAREALMALDRESGDFMQKMQAANAKRTADLKALLTSDADKAKFDENAARGRGRRGGGN